MPDSSPFSTVYDLVIVGGGFAGLAAASVASRSGQRVLLMERCAALAWECGWCHGQDLGDDDAPGWRSWIERLTAVGGMPQGLPDGARVEIEAHVLLQESGIDVLFYAGPVAAEYDAKGLVANVILGTKSGLRRLSARRWIDASDAGELCAVVDADWRAPVARSFHHTIAWRSVAWSDRDRAGDLVDTDVGHWAWRRSGWNDERLLCLDLPGETAHPRLALLPAIRALRAEAGAALDAAVVSHASVRPFARYPARPSPAHLPANLVTAIPGCCGRVANSLSARWAIGSAAAARLPALPVAAVLGALPDPDWPEAPRFRADIVVAGLGTGGALAAIAAARSGAQVLGVEPLPFAGGIGSGGGIHVYYFGVRGGLQEEVDQRIRDILPAFAGTGQITGFHPEAKKLVLETMLHDAGVDWLPDATLVAARREGRRIVEALITTPEGPVRARAEGWIDGTGDGDLAAAAGCIYRYGRTGDGRLHAYTQSVACTRIQDGRPKVAVVNFDSGFVDASDVVDLTRARRAGVLQHLRAGVDPAQRAVQVCPAIGIRQDRHIDTDAILTLDDLIERRRFPDAIALVGAHYDNHAADCEQESPAAILWVWGCDAWRTRIAGELPYGTLVPRDLDNCWLASRCLGVSEEAHHCVRMQRDIQRIGEVAGLAAALARGRGSRHLDLGELRRLLERSGAMPTGTGFEDHDPLTAGATMPASACRGSVERGDAQTALTGGDPVGCWRLAHAPGPAAVEVLRAGLAHAEAAISFRAAVILAWRGDPAGRSRLVAAINAGEDGQPERKLGYHAPRWFIALAFLRFIPHHDVLPLLAGFTDRPQTPFRVRVVVAMVLEALVAAVPAQAAAVLALLPRLTAFSAPDASGRPNRHLHTTPLDPANTYAVTENDTWQLHLAVTRIRIRCGLPPTPEARAASMDPRSGVRRMFAAVFASIPGAPRIRAVEMRA